MSECEGEEGARRGSIESIPVVLYGILPKPVGETRLRALQLVHALGCLDDTTVAQLSDSGSGALEADVRPSNPGYQFISLLGERSSAGMHFLVSNVILRAPDQAIRKAGSATIQRISRIALSEANHALLNSLGQFSSYELECACYPTALDVLGADLKYPRHFVFVAAMREQL